jgi:CBS domain-containing protein
MTPNPVLAAEWESMQAALQKMRQFGVRRLPVVNGYRELVGILAIDDVLKVIAGDAQDVVSTIRGGRRMEGESRP